MVFTKQYLQTEEHALSNALRNGAFQLKQLKIDARPRPFLYGLDITRRCRKATSSMVKTVKDFAAIKTLLGWTVNAFKA